LKSGTELETKYLVLVFSVSIPVISVRFLVLVNFATKVVGSKKTQTNGGEILKFRWVPFSVWAFSIVTPGIPTHYLFFTKKFTSYLLLLKGQQGSPLPIFLFSLIRESTKEPHIQEEKGGGGR
jgi:hypothetical protein